MTTKEDNYFMWITSDLFGHIRLQHHNGIIEAVDDPRFKWAIGKELFEVEEYVSDKEIKKAMDDAESQRNLFERRKQLEVIYEQDRKKVAILTRERDEDKTNDDVN